MFAYFFTLLDGKWLEADMVFNNILTGSDENIQPE
jgi:hypothetical protein